MWVESTSGHSLSILSNVLQQVRTSIRMTFRGHSNVGIGGMRLHNIQVDVYCRANTLPQGTPLQMCVSIDRPEARGIGLPLNASICEPRSRRFLSKVVSWRRIRRRKDPARDFVTIGILAYRSSALCGHSHTRDRPPLPPVPY